MISVLFFMGCQTSEKPNYAKVTKEVPQQKDTTIKEKGYENELLQKRSQQLEARNNLLNKMVFGKKSEKKENEEPDVTISKKRGQRRGHTGHGRKIPENMTRS